MTTIDYLLIFGCLVATAGVLAYGSLALWLLYKGRER